MPTLLGQDITQRQQIAPVIGADPAYMRKLEQSIRWGEGIENYVEPVMIEPENYTPTKQINENEGEEIFTEAEQVGLEDDIKTYLNLEKAKWDSGYGETRLADCRLENEEDGNVKKNGLGQKMFTLPMEIWAEYETNPDFDWGDKNDLKWIMNKYPSLKCEGNLM